MREKVKTKKNVLVNEIMYFKKGQVVEVLQDHGFGVKVKHPEKGTMANYCWLFNHELVMP